MNKKHPLEGVRIISLIHGKNTIITSLGLIDRDKKYLLNQKPNTKVLVMVDTRFIKTTFLGYSKSCAYCTQSSREECLGSAKLEGFKIPHCISYGVDNYFPLMFPLNSKILKRITLHYILNYVL